MKSEDAIIDALAAYVVEQADSDFRENVADLTKECESPIERVLLAAMLTRGSFAFNPSWQQGIDFYHHVNTRGLRTFSDLMKNDKYLYDIEYIGAVYSQVPLEAKYRADIYIEAFERETGRRWLRMAVECDGHEFHERTKQQAARDKARDRWFQARGVIVLRFTGAEIWADPQKCVDEIEEAFFAAWRRHYRPGHE